MVRLLHKFANATVKSFFTFILIQAFTPVIQVTLPKALSSLLLQIHQVNYIIFQQKKSIHTLNRMTSNKTIWSVSYHVFLSTFKKKLKNLRRELRYNNHLKLCYQIMHFEILPKYAMLHHTNP